MVPASRINRTVKKLFKVSKKGVRINTGACLRISTGMDTKWDMTTVFAEF